MLRLVACITVCCMGTSRTPRSVQSDPEPLEATGLHRAQTRTTLGSLAEALLHPDKPHVRREAHLGRERRFREYVRKKHRR